MANTRGGITRKIATALALLFCVGGAAFSQVVWNGNVDNDWSVGGNWDGGAAPLPTQAAQLPTGRPNYPNLSVNSVDATVTSLEILGTAFLNVGGRTLTVTGSGDVFGTGTLTGGSGTVTVGGSITVNTYNETAGNTSVGGSFTPVNFNENGGTVTFTSATSPVTMGAHTYHNVTIAKGALADSVQLTGPTVVGNALTVNTGTVQNLGHTLEIGQPLTMALGTGRIQIGAGTLDAGLNPVAVNLGTIQIGTGSLTANSLTVGGGTFNATGAATVTLGAGGLAQTAGTLNANAATFTTSGNVSLTGGTFNQDTSTVRMTGAGTTVRVTPGRQLHHLQVAPGAANTVTVLTDPLTMSGNLSIDTGTFDVGAGNLQVTVQGSWSNSAGAGGFDARAGTVRFTGAVDQDVTSGGSPFHTLEIDKSANSVFLQDEVTAGHDLVLTDGTLSLNDQDLIVGRHVSGGGTLVATASEVVVAGNSGVGDFSPASFTPATSTVQLRGTGAIGAGLTLHNVFKQTTATTSTLTGDIVLTGSMLLVDGTLSAATHTIRVAQSWARLAPAVFDAGTGRVVLDGAGDHTLNPAGGAFYDLYIDKSGGGSITLANALTVTNNIELAGGTFDVSASNLQVTVGGNWTGGTFAARNGTVVFTGGLAQTVSAGALEFHNVTLSKSGNGITFSVVVLEVTNGLTVNAGAYGVSFPGLGTSIAGSTTFNNTGALTLGNGGALTFIGGLTATAPSSRTVNGTVRTNGGVMSLGPVTLAGASILRTDHFTPAGANLTVGTINGNAALTLAAGSGGTIETGLIGATALTSLTVDGALIARFTNNVTTSGPQTLTAGTIETNGIHQTTNDPILIDGNLGMQGDTQLRTGGGVGDITVTGTVTNPASRTLSLAAGGGAVDLQAAVGGGTALTSLTVASATTARFGGNVTTTGTQDVTAGTIQTNATHTTGGGNIVFTGDLDLQANTALTTGGGIGDITVTGTVTNAVGRTLTLTAGTGSVDLQGAVGGGTALTSLTVVSATTARFGGNVTTTGAQALTAGTIRTNGTHTTANANVNFDGNVELENNTWVLTDSGAGNVTFGATLNAAADLVQGLEVASGGGAITFAGAIGGTGRLAYLRIDRTGGGVTIPGLTVGGELRVFANGAVDQAGPLRGDTLHVKTRLDGGAPITLEDDSNDFLTVVFETRNTADGADAAGAVSYRDADGFALGNLGAAGAGIRTTAVTTLQSGGAVAQTGRLLAGTLRLLGSGPYTLINATNAVTTLAASVGGSVSYTNTNALTVGTVGPTSGINTGGNPLTLVAGAGVAGALTIAQNTAATTTSLTGVGVTVNGGVTVNAGAGTILVDANDGNVNLNTSLLSTTNATATAVVIRDASVVTLGSILTGAGGTLVLGQGAPDNLTGAVTQTAATAINVGRVIANTDGSITLTAGTNLMAELGPVTRGGTLSVVNSSAALAVTGAINTGGIGNNVVIVSTGGLLSINAGSNISATGVGTVSLSGTGVTNNAAVSGAAGVTVSGGTGTITNTGSFTSSNAAVLLQADDMALGGTVNAGSGPVTVRPSTGTRPIDLGSNTAGRLGLTDGELDTITTTGPLTIGDPAHTGQILITAAVNPANAPNVSVVNQQGGIAIGANLTANTSLTLTANGGGAAGAITRTGGALSATGGALTLSARDGIGAIPGNPVVIGAVGGVLSATNTITGDLFLNTGAVTLGGANPALSQYNGGALRIDSTGSIVIGGNVNVGGVGSIILNATGTITRTAGTLTAGTVQLGLSGTTTNVGVDPDPVITAATTDLSLRSSAGEVFVTNTGNVNVNVTAVGGQARLTNAGTLTTNGGVTTTGPNTVDIVSSGQINAGHNITGPGGVAVTVTGAGAQLNQTAGVISTVDSPVVLIADDMNLGGATNAGAGAVTIRPNAAARPIDLGAVTAGRLSLTAAELNTITTTGLLTIGRDTHTGNIRIAGAVSPGGATGGIRLINRTGGIAVNQILTSGGGTQPVDLIADGGAAVAGVITSAGGGAGIAASLLVTRSNGGTQLNGTGNAVAQWDAVNSASGNVVLVNATGVSISGLTQPVGALTLSARGPINQTGAVTVSGNANLTADDGGTLQDITLDDALNDFGAVVVAAAQNVTVADVNTFVFGPGASSIDGDLVVNTQTGLTQTGTVSVGGTTTVTANAGPITLNLAGNDFDGTFTLSNTGANDVSIRDAANLSLAGLTAPRNLTIQAGGTTTALGGFGIAGDFTIAGGAFVPGPHTITFNGAAPQTVATNNQPFFNVTKTGGSRVTVSSGSFTVNGTLVIDGVDPGNEIDVTTQTFTINTLSNDGRFRLRGTQNPQTITNPDINSGITEYYGAGAATIRLGPFFNLEVAKAATTATLNSDTTVHGDLSVVSGTLVLAGNDLLLPTNNGLAGSVSVVGTGTIDASAAGSNISLGGNWTNTGTFISGGGTNEVTFTRASGGTAIIDGDTTFHRLRYDVPGGTLAITDGTEITIPPTGRFRANGAPGVGNEVTLTASPDPGGPPDPPGPPPFPDAIGSTADPRQWTLTLQPGALLEIDEIEVRWSFAEFVIVLPPGTIALYATTNWRSDLPVFSARTLDTDGSGKINRIAVVTAGPLNYQFGTPPNEFRVVVQGYTVLGYTTDGPPDEFHVVLEPQPFLDTDERPLWRIEQNNTLADSATSTRIVLIDELVPGLNTVEIDGEFWVLPDDAAPPVIGYTLAIPGRNQVYVHFSEPVQNVGGGVLMPGVNITSTAGPVSTVAPAPGGVAGQDWLVTLTNPLTASQIAAGGPATVAGVNIEDTATPANPLRPARSTHRVSDLFLVPPDAQELTPVFAREIDLERDADRGGIGLIRDFDGTAYLQPRDLLLQLFAQTPTFTPGDLRLVYDSDVPASFVNNGLWLPTFAETDFSGIVPFPRTAGPVLSGAPAVAGNLAEFTIPPTGPVRTGVTLDFFPRIQTGPPPLYAARIFSPNSPTWFRNVRPFSFGVAEVFRQRGSVSILNNVINPENGERVFLHYDLARAGTVSINVFNLAGDLIDVIHRGRQDAGEHSTSWDGTNRQGRIVARGIYFIRVRGPDIDEYRKVMVVK